MKDVIRNQCEGQEFINRWAAITEGGPYHIEIKPFKRPKSADQRAKFHVLCRELAIRLRDDHGIDTSPEGVKFYMKDKYGPSEPYVAPDGRSRAMLLSSEDWNIEQASEMIEHLLREAAEHEVYLQ